MRINIMVQCLVSRSNGNGVLVTWVPRDFSKVGEKIEIDDGGIFDVYEIKEVYYNSIMDEGSVIEKYPNRRKVRKLIHLNNVK